MEWHDRRIGAGTEWKVEIDADIDSAAVVLLLVSSDFLASEYCSSIEARRALKRHEAGRLVVAGIVVVVAQAK